MARGLSFVLQGVDKLTGTLKRAGRGLENLQGKRDKNPPKKHGNIPL